MTDSSTNSAIWPQTLGPGDDLYYVKDLETGDVDYLVFSSMEYRRTFIRDNAHWWPAGPNFVKDFDDPKYTIKFVEPDYIAEYDKLESSQALDKIKQTPPSRSEKSSTVESRPTELANNTLGI